MSTGGTGGTDGSGLRDAVSAELNPDPDDTTDPGPQPPPVPDRPADGAAKGKWVAYLVALGASEDALTGGLRSWDAGREEYVSADLPRDELIALADKLGG